MLSVTLFAAVAVLLLQPSEGKVTTQHIKERAALLSARVISQKEDDSSSHDIILKERVRLHGLPKTVGYLLYNIIATPFEWMWDVVCLPFNVVKTIIFAYRISQEKKAESKTS